MILETLVANTSLLFVKGFYLTVKPTQLKNFLFYPVLGLLFGFLLLVVVFLGILFCFCFLSKRLFLLKCEEYTDKVQMWKTSP